MDPLRAEVLRLAAASALDDLTTFAAHTAPHTCPRCGLTVPALAPRPCLAGCNTTLSAPRPRPTTCPPDPELWLLAHLPVLQAALQALVAAAPPFDPAPDHARDPRIRTY